MIDWERVAELRSEIGDDGFAEVLDLFLDEVEDAVACLGQPTRKLSDDLHFLKGSAWNFGFRQFGEMCQEGERALATGSVSAVDSSAIRECYDISKREFMARVAGYCSGCLSHPAAA
ncbi:Hpt domain-containing protein [Phaeovulum sp.]|uniref:Hpt domain-containing protein n=1 Tax=Phaeovulum sp. TaxID=2934796 RepID=UPI0039E50B3E